MPFYSEALIEPHELASRLNGEDRPMKILDASFTMPGASPSARERYAQKRIGQAAFFDIDAVADKTSPLPHMLPAPEDFARAVSLLGLSTGDEIAVYGQGGLIMGPCRAWWMFRAFGHDRVRVLNGGLPLWEACGLPVESGPAPAPPPGSFTAAFRPELVKNLEQVREACESKDVCILDARAPERFAGSAPEPRPGLRSGHIPGSGNLPVGFLVEGDSGRLKSPGQLEDLLRGCGAESARQIITTCGSGVTACVIALALYVTGRPDAAVYDGSWSEWGQENLKMPVDSMHTSD